MACHNAHVLLLLFVVIASAWCMIDAQVTLPIPGSDTSIGQMEQTVQSDPESEAMDPLVALWKKAKKLGMCIFEKQLVHCSKDYSYGSEEPYGGTQPGYGYDYTPKYGTIEAYKDTTEDKYGSEGYKHGGRGKTKKHYYKDTSDSEEYENDDYNGKYDKVDHTKYKQHGYEDAAESDLYIKQKTNQDTDKNDDGYIKHKKHSYKDEDEGESDAYGGKGKHHRADGYSGGRKHGKYGKYDSSADGDYKGARAGKDYGNSYNGNGDSYGQGSQGYQPKQQHATNNYPPQPSSSYITLTPDGGEDADEDDYGYYSDVSAPVQVASSVSKLWDYGWNTAAALAEPGLRRTPVTGAPWKSRRLAL